MFLANCNLKFRDVLMYILALLIIVYAKTNVTKSMFYNKALSDTNNTYIM